MTNNRKSIKDLQHGDTISLENGAGSIIAAKQSRLFECPKGHIYEVTWRDLADGTEQTQLVHGDDEIALVTMQ